MDETSHQPQTSEPPSTSRLSKRRPMGITFLALALLAGGVGLALRMAIQGRPAANAQRHHNGALLAADFQTRIKGNSQAGSLQEILAHPDVIPTHKHPLLGKQAPDFELADSGGKAWNLHQLLADGPVVLVFYHGCSCALCVRQLFDGNNDLPLFNEIGARIVEISADPPELTRQRFEPYGAFGFPMLSDPGNKTAKAYQVFRRTQDGMTESRPLHGTFIIDRHGVVQWVNVGDMPFRRNSALLYQLAKIEGRLPSAEPDHDLRR